MFFKKIIPVFELFLAAARLGCSLLVRCTACLYFNSGNKGTKAQS